MTEIQKVCLQCNKKIIGRSDKKFCDDGCRNQYNNAKNQVDSVWVKKINHLLAKNRRILMQLLGTEEMQKVSLEKFQVLQFNPKFFTHTYTTQKGVTYYFVYEMGYLPLENDKMLIVKRNPMD